MIGFGYLSLIIGTIVYINGCKKEEISEEKRIFNNLAELSKDISKELRKDNNMNNELLGELYTKLAMYLEDYDSDSLSTKAFENVVKAYNAASTIIADSSVHTAFNAIYTAKFDYEYKNDETLLNVRNALLKSKSTLAFTLDTSKELENIKLKELFTYFYKYFVYLEDIFTKIQNEIIENETERTSLGPLKFATENTDIHLDQNLFESSARNEDFYTNINTEIYPLKFSAGGKISFQAYSDSREDVDIYFKLQYLPNPYDDLVVDNLSAKITSNQLYYEIDIPSQDENTYSEFKLYIVTKNQPVNISEIFLHVYGPEYEPKTQENIISYLSRSKIHTKFFKYLKDNKGLDLIELLQSSDEKFTVFAPIDSDFDLLEELEIDFSNYDVKYQFANEIINILALKSNLDSSYGRITMYNNVDVDYYYNNEGIFVINFIKIIQSDIYKSNGIIHIMEDAFIARPASLLLYIQLSLAFFGSVFDVTTNVYNIPDEADEFAGFRVEDGNEIYPIILPYGGKLIFTAKSLTDSEIELRFKFQLAAFPEDNPSYDFEPISINKEEKLYKIDIPSQGIKTFREFLLFMDKNTEAYINDIYIISNKPESVDPKPSLSKIIEGTKFNEILEKANLNSNLEFDDFTIFIPTDKALLDSGLEDIDNINNLVSVLSYFLVENTIIKSNTIVDKQTYTASDTNQIHLDKVNNNITVNNANIIFSDIDVSNGIIHIIDEVIISPSLQLQLPTSELDLPIQIIFTIPFGGVEQIGDSYIFPSHAEDYAGFSIDLNSNINTESVALPYGGLITFNALVQSGNEVEIYFKFEREPYKGNGSIKDITEPSYSTNKITINTQKDYEIKIPPQLFKTYKNIILYLTTRDEAVNITNITLNSGRIHQIQVGNFFFNPDELTIKKGDSVVWTNIEGFHAINFDKNSITGESYNNPIIFDFTPGSAVFVWSQTFNIPGEYNYDCSIGNHAQQGMVGKIIVEE